MKKLSLFITILILAFNSSFAQKLYVWCPDSQNVKGRAGFLENQEVNLVIFDGRTLPNKSRIKCTSEEIVHALFNYVVKAYPSAKFSLLGDSMYFKKPEPNKITIKIGISAYQAGFGADITVAIGSVGGHFSYGIIPKGKWNGITGYYIQIFDLRNSKENKQAKEISEVSSKSNLWGYKTAKTCLNTSYIEANQKLLFFIDNTLMNQ